MTTFRLFQTQRVCRRQNFNVDINGRKFSILIENTVEKGEIARYQQFLLFPQCFQMTNTVDTLNQGLFGKGLTLFKAIPGFYKSVAKIF